MSIIQEVRDGIQLVSEGIESIRTIHAAIRDGRQYIAAKHRDVATDLIAMCQEMRGTLDAIAVSSAIITHFKFTVSGPDVAREPARFNERLMDHKAHARHVEDQLDALRGRCQIIYNHACSLEKAAQRRGFSSLTQFLGLSSPTRVQQLAVALQEIYGGEGQFHANVYGMKTVLTQALAAVETELGPSGTMDPANVPKAAAVLGEYAEAFGELESNANFGALQLQELINDLQR